MSILMALSGFVNMLPRGGDRQRSRSEISKVQWCVDSTLLGRLAADTLLRGAE